MDRGPRVGRGARAERACGIGVDRRVRRPAGQRDISYQRHNEETGLENQCWKDSWDSISYSDGRLPGFPRATCELQGYAYDAKVRGARLARLVWKDSELADRLEKEAADLKRRFRSPASSSRRSANSGSFQTRRAKRAPRILASYA